MSLTLAEARARAALVSDVSYEIDLDLSSTASFRSRTRVRFTCAGSETFLELGRAQDLVVEGCPSSYSDGRIALTGLTPGAATEITVSARLPYVTDGNGMHTFTDPADGELYVSAYCGIDVAQLVFACFDQNDLKAALTLTVRADPAWTVLANGDAVSSEPGVSRFAATPPIPVALFVVCAGPWHSVRWEHAGLSLGWHARASLATELDRDAAELQATTNACFDHYAEIFTEPYAFGTYDQVLVPGLNWGAQENPGCVTFRDEMLPRGRLTDTERERRAMVIAHEMAHMWFGDLVTMTWWEDTWLQESFADYMGFRVSEAIGFRGSRVAFEIGEKPGGYAADARRSSHPVAPLATDVPDVDSAFNNFDPISYAKGNAVIRQLVVWLGDEEFLAGVNAYLTRHRFGNATLGDFVAALDAASSRDVTGWVELWLRTTGFDTLRVSRDGDVPVLTREGVRPHRVTVTSYDAGRDGTILPVDRVVLDVGDQPVPLPDFTGRLVVPDSGGDSFARLRLDDRSWAAVAAGLAGLPDDLTRAVLWASVLDQVREGTLSADAYLRVLAGQLPWETSATIVESVLRHTSRWVLPRYVPLAAAPAAVDVVAAACAAGLRSRPREQVALAFARGLAWSSRDLPLLTSWLAEDRTDQGLALDPVLRWSIVHRLAELGGDESLIAAEEARDPSGAPEGAATARAARPIPEAKAAAWTAMSEDPDVSNRLFTAHAAGLWSVEQPDLVAPYVSAYLTAAPALAQARGQAFAQEIGFAFPALGLTDTQLAELRTALAGDVHPVLRRKWEDTLDDLT